MKFIKKINLGLILAIIAIIAVITYSVQLESQRKTAKEDIKKSCENFINLTNKYATLPSEYQTIGQKSTDTNLTNFYSEMENDLNAQTTNESTANIQKTILTETIKNQLIDTSKITVSFNREITKISSYEFDGSQVTVTFDSKTTIKQKYNDVNQETGEISEKISEKTTQVEGETITLEKNDDTWKIVYANLDYSEINGLNYMYEYSTSIM
ncbi:MAG: hypothetical protein J6A89_05195 [Clostridia bacterium]|nr:hypothetical protein [Clostridia bacterium]